MASIFSEFSSTLQKLGQDIEIDDANTEIDIIKPLNMNGNIVTHVRDPVDGGDVVNLQTMELKISQAITGHSTSLSNYYTKPEIDTKVNIINDEITSVTATAQQNDATITDLQTNVANIQQQQTTNTSNITALQTQQATNTTDISSNTTTITNNYNVLNQFCQDNDNKIDGVLQRANENKGLISSNTQEIQQLKDTQSTVNTDITALQTRTNNIYVNGPHVGINASNPQSGLVINGKRQQTPTQAGVHLGWYDITSNYGYGMELCNEGTATGSVIDFTQVGTDYRGRIMYYMGSGNNNDTNAPYMSFSTSNNTGDVKECLRLYNNAIQANGLPIQNVATPTANTDVATKQYVDNAISIQESPIVSYYNRGLYKRITLVNGDNNFAGLDITFPSAGDWRVDFQFRLTCGNYPTSPFNVYFQFPDFKIGRIEPYTNPSGQVTNGGFVRYMTDFNVFDGALEKSVTIFVVFDNLSTIQGQPMNNAIIELIATIDAIKTRAIQVILS